jgi:hypothetical protein
LVVDRGLTKREQDHSWEWKERSVQKRDFTGPTLLEMYGNPGKIGRSEAG